MDYDEAILAQDGEEAAGIQVKHAGARRLVTRTVKDWRVGVVETTYRRQAREARARRATNKAELEAWEAENVVRREARMQALQKAMRHAGGEGE